MLKSRLIFSAAPRHTRGGFTLVELLVVIGIIAILAGVALGPITNGLKKAKQSKGMQDARSIGLVGLTYATDNDNFPAGDATNGFTAVGICKQLLQGKYLGDPTLFYEAGPGKIKYAGIGGTYADFTATNLDWDFTATDSSGTITGVSTSSSDLLPWVFSTGNTITYPAAGGVGFDLTLTAATNTFKADGIAVCYKSGSAAFKTATTATGSPIVSEFIPKAYDDQTTYTQLKAE